MEKVSYSRGRSEAGRQREKEGQMLVQVRPSAVNRNDAQSWHLAWLGLSVWLATAISQCVYVSVYHRLE